MSEAEETIKKALNELLGNPAIAARIADGIVHGEKRPAGWSRHSKATYYKAAYANQVKEQLDGMMADRKDRQWLFDQWPDARPNTIYLRVNQSLRYLLENMDPDNTYSLFMECVRVTRDRKGVYLEFIPELRAAVTGKGGLDFIPEVITPQGKIPRWRECITKYVEDAQVGDKPLVIEGLMLTPEEVTQTKTELLGLKNVMVHITATTIKILKRNVT